MNKKILIASLFATFMLLVPMTSVVGVISKNVTMDNQPPNPPTITGPKTGKVGVAYAFTFNAVDPDGDNVSYYVDWGDGTSYGWTDYIESGFDISISHTWTKKGKYLIRCKANDTHGAESDWATFYGFNVRENKTATYVTVDNQPSVEDCGCQVVDRYDLFRVKLLLVRIKVITNQLLLRFGHIPEITEECQEILDIINSNRQRDFPIICDILEPILNNSGEKGMLYLEKAREAQDAGNTILMLLYFSIFWMYVGIIGIILSIGASFGCDWAQST